MNFIKDEEFEIKDGLLILKYKCAGDIGFIKEIQYMKWQAMIDSIV